MVWPYTCTPSTRVRTSVPCSQNGKLSGLLLRLLAGARDSARDCTLINSTECVDVSNVVGETCRAPERIFCSRLRSQRGCISVVAREASKQQAGARCVQTKSRRQSSLPGISCARVRTYETNERTNKHISCSIRRANNKLKSHPTPCNARLSAPSISSSCSATKNIIPVHHTPA
jgi:hypothetical protein